MLSHSIRHVDARAHDAKRNIFSANVCNHLRQIVPYGILTPTATVYKMDLQTITERVEDNLVFLLVVVQIPTCEDSSSAHEQVQLDIHLLQSFFGQFIGQF